MPDIIKPATLGGLHLGIEPAMTRQMVVGDGARYEAAGEVTSKYGNAEMDLVFPDEGITDADPHAETISPFDVGQRTRGWNALYDRRLHTTPTEVIRDSVFQEGSVGSPDYFTLSGGWTYNVANSWMRYDHNVGTNTLKQFKSNFQSPYQEGETYIARYTVVQIIDDGFTPTITTNFASVAVTLPKTAGYHEVEFTLAATLIDFEIDVANGSGGGAWTLENFSVKRKAEEDYVIPERLNIIYKGIDGNFFMNGDQAGSGDIIRGLPEFSDPTTRAKILTRSRTAYIIDSGSKPQIFRPRPVDQQKYLGRVKYDLRKFGIEWPRKGDDRPQLELVSETVGLPQGTFRFRLALENDMGDVSAYSLFNAIVLVEDNLQKVRLTFPTLPDDLLDGTDPVTHWRVYVSFVAEYGEGNVQSTEPSVFKYWDSFRVDSVTTVDYNWATNRYISNWPDITPSRAYSPKLRDLVIINDIGYAIADNDVVFREMIDTQGDPVPVRWTNQFPGTQPATFATHFDRTVIKEWVTTPDILLISAPGEPHQFVDDIRFGRGEGEFGVGVSALGDNCVIFTNQDILMYDPASGSIRRTNAGVGAMARDLIHKDEYGIRFVGSDGLPRLFNGATVENVATEIMPIFTRRDHAGYYSKFDRKYAQEGTATSGDGKFWMIYPTARNPGEIPPGKPEIDDTPARSTAVLDSRHGGLWSVDLSGFEQTRWLGRESRLLGADFAGRFHWMEESGSDRFEWEFRWFGGTDRVLFRKLSMEIDTHGQNLSVTTRVDENGLVEQGYTVNTTKRQEVKLQLPGRFRGRHMSVRFSSPQRAERPILYDLQCEIEPVGVF